MIKHRDSEKATGMSSQMIDGGRRGGRGNRLPRYRVVVGNLTS